MTEDIAVSRWGKGRIIGGKSKASRRLAFHMKARVRPASGREREALPEGWRQRYMVVLYSEKKILASDDKKDQRADILDMGEESYEVAVVEEYKGLGLNHFKVFAARRND